MLLAVSYDDAFTCCSSKTFATLLSESQPSHDVDSLVEKARRIWWGQVPVEGWLEAFAAHPRIGDAAGLKKKYGAFGNMSSTEQSTALSSNNDALFEELAQRNRQYEQKFGHIFIVFASGKTAAEMLDILKRRFNNSPYEEIGNAAREQMKITELRLRRLVEAWQPASSSTSHNDSYPPAATPPPQSATPLDRAEIRTGQILHHLSPTLVPVPAPGRSPITTHVLDATLGVPAADLPIVLFKHPEGAPCSIWEPIAQGITNDDGRIGNLLVPGSLQPGHYKMWFDTGVYLQACHAKFPNMFSPQPFYPEAAVEFVITPEMIHQHFHIPLLLSPYSYSTYKGS